MSGQQQIGKKFFGSGHCADRGELEAQYAGNANKEALVWYTLHLHFHFKLHLFCILFEIVCTSICLYTGMAECKRRSNGTMVRHFYYLSGTWTTIWDLLNSFWCSENAGLYVLFNNLVYF